MIIVENKQIIAFRCTDLLNCYTISKRYISELRTPEYMRLKHKLIV